MASNKVTREDMFQDPLRIAFMPDIHFHDIYAEFEDGSFEGVQNGISGRSATIRTMQSQMNSTRLFNENYFALLAALDDVVARGVTLVALPGDFSDDGQPIHISGIRRILNHYRDEHGLEFFAAPGNHDPVRPFDSPGGKPDFLGEGGLEQPIFSLGTPECLEVGNNRNEPQAGQRLKTICTEEIRHLGYQGIMKDLGDFGFYPKSTDLYWETPYSSYQTYDFNSALEQAAFQNRQYEICLQGSGGRYRESGYSDCSLVPDASYLVEPVPGLWLLAIDANVYAPKPSLEEGEPLNFEGSGNAGYNRMLTHKIHVVEWMRDVVERAEDGGKQLIAFSHFPMMEFYDGQSEAIGELFGPENFQLKRRPASDVSQVLADTGLKIHVGGHMHMNDTGVIHGSRGKTLFNIQAPSLAAYVPAYKLMTLRAESRVEIETVILDQVPRFSELFEHYHQEYQARASAGSPPAWDKAILGSSDYREFTAWHIRELTRQRFLPSEWPEDFKQKLFSLTGEDLLVLVVLQNSEHGGSLPTLSQLKQSDQWREAKRRAGMLSAQRDLDLNDFKSWNGFDLAVDFYRLRNAGELARGDIDASRLAQYRLLTRLAAHPPHPKTDQQQEGDPMSQFTVRLRQLFGILEAFQSGAPDDHFLLDLESGEIKALGHSNP